MEGSVTRDSARPSPPTQAPSTTTQLSTATHVIATQPLSTSRPVSHTASDQCSFQTEKKHAAALHKGASCPIGSALTSQPQASPSAPTATQQTTEGSTLVPSPVHKDPVPLPEHRPVQRTYSVLRTGQRPSNLHISSGGSTSVHKRTDRPKSVRLVVESTTDGGSSSTHSPSDDHRDSHHERATNYNKQTGGDSADLSSVRRGQSLDRDRDRSAFFVRFLKRRSTSSKFAAAHAQSRGNKPRGSLPLATVAGVNPHQHHVFFSPRITSGHHHNHQQQQQAQCDKKFSLPPTSGSSIPSKATSSTPSTSPSRTSRRGSSPHVRLQVATSSSNNTTSPTGATTSSNSISATNSSSTKNACASPAKKFTSSSSPRSPHSPRSKSFVASPSKLALASSSSLLRSVSNVQPVSRKRVTTAPATPGDPHPTATTTSSHPIIGNSATVKHSVSVTFAERPTTLFEGAKSRQPARGMDERRSSLARLVSIRRPTTSSSESSSLLANDQWDLDRTPSSGPGASGGLGASAAAAQWEALERMFMRTELRVAVVGPRHSGKSALVERFVRDEFSERYSPTRAPQLSHPVFVTSSHMFDVKLFDVPPKSHSCCCCTNSEGGEEDTGLSAHRNSNAHVNDRVQRIGLASLCELPTDDADNPIEAFVLVFDASSPESFHELRVFRERLLAERQNATIIVAATKVDLLPAYRRNAWMEARRAQLSACLTRGLSSDPEMSRKSSDNDDGRHSRLNIAALNLKEHTPSSNGGGSQPPRSRTALGLDTLVTPSGGSGVTGGGGSVSGAGVGGGGSSTSLMQRLRKMSTSRSVANELHALARPSSSGGGTMGLLAFGRRENSHHEGLVSLFAAHTALLHSAAVPQSTSPHILPHAFHMGVGGSKANRMLGLDAFTIVRKHWKLELVECSARHNFHVTHVFRELVTLVEAAQARAADDKKRAAAAAKRPRTPLGLGLRTDRCRVS